MAAQLCVTVLTTSPAHFLLIGETHQSTLTRGMRALPRLTSSVLLVVSSSRCLPRRVRLRVFLVVSSSPGPHRTPIDVSSSILRRHAGLLSVTHSPSPRLALSTCPHRHIPRHPARWPSHSITRVERSHLLSPRNYDSTFARRTLDPAPGPRVLSMTRPNTSERSERWNDGTPKPTLTPPVPYRTGRVGRGSMYRPSKLERMLMFVDNFPAVYPASFRPSTAIRISALPSDTTSVLPVLIQHSVSVILCSLPRCTVEFGFCYRLKRAGLVSRDCHGGTRSLFRARRLVRHHCKLRP